MLAKDDDWLTAGNQLDDSLLMDDLWDDDAAPQDDKGTASHSTGSTFPQDNAETLPQKGDGAGSSSNVPTVPQSNRESIPGENANTFPQYFDDSFHSLTKAQPISPTATHSTGRRRPIPTG